MWLYSLLLGLAVFVTAALGDWAWTLFIRGVEERRPRVAVPASMFLWLLGAIGIVGLVTDPWIVTPAGTLGAGVGVWVGIKTAKGQPKDHEPRAIALAAKLAKPALPVVAIDQMKVYDKDWDSQLQGWRTPEGFLSLEAYLSVNQAHNIGYGFHAYEEHLAAGGKDNG